MNDHDKIYFNWTQTAIECYEIGCRCSICPLKRVMETKCFMKKAVIELVKNVGRPQKPLNDNIFKGLNDIQNKIIKALINGAKTNKDLAKALNMTQTAINYNLMQIYKVTSTQGVIYKTFRHKIKTLKNFLDNYTKEKDS